MKQRTISVTEASRNFAECINRVRYQGLSFLLVKNGTAVARLVPATGASATVIEGNVQAEETASLPLQSSQLNLPGDVRRELALETQSAAPAASSREKSGQW